MSNFYSAKRLIRFSPPHRLLWFIISGVATHPPRRLDGRPHDEWIAWWGAKYDAHMANHGIPMWAAPVCRKMW